MQVEAAARRPHGPAGNAPSTGRNLSARRHASAGSHRREPSRSKTVAAGTRAPRATAAVPEPAGAAVARKKTASSRAAAKPAAKGGRAKPAITPSPGTEGAVLTAVPTDDGEDGEQRASAAAREREDLDYPKWAKRVDRYLDVLEAGLWPDLIIVGGGVSKKAHKWVPLLTTRTTVVPAQLQNDAGIVGAALAAAEDARTRLTERRGRVMTRVIPWGPAFRRGAASADAPPREITGPEHRGTARRSESARIRDGGIPPTRRYNERAPARRPPAGRDPLPAQRPNAARSAGISQLPGCEDRSRCPRTTRPPGNEPSTGRNLSARRPASTGRSRSEHPLDDGGHRYPGSPHQRRGRQAGQDRDGRCGTGRRRAGRPEEGPGEDRRQGHPRQADDRPVPGRR